MDEAIEVRLKQVAAQTNAKRLNKTTPCTKVGHYMDKLLVERYVIGIQ